MPYTGLRKFLTAQPQEPAHNTPIMRIAYYCLQYIPNCAIPGSYAPFALPSIKQMSHNRPTRVACCWGCFRNPYTRQEENSVRIITVVLQH